MVKLYWICIVFFIIIMYSSTVFSFPTWQIPVTTMSRQQWELILSLCASHRQQYHVLNNQPADNDLGIAKPGEIYHLRIPFNLLPSNFAAQTHFSTHVSSNTTRQEETSVGCLPVLKLESAWSVGFCLEKIGCYEEVKVNVSLYFS